MKIAVAGFALESVSFLPVFTEKSDFDLAACRSGVMLDVLRSTETVGGGFLDVLAMQNAEVVPIFYVDCSAGGPATDDAFEAYRDELIKGIEDNLDGLSGVLLYLHGAMTTPGYLDPESEILEAVRSVIGPDMPLSVAFDLHGNLSMKTAELCSSFCGFHYSPHTDMAETGRRAARLLVDQINGVIMPNITMKKLPIVLPSIFTATGIEPLAGLVRHGLDQVRREVGVLDLSLFCGFAYADVPDIGLSVVVVTDGDAETGERIAQAYCDKINAVAENLNHQEQVVPHTEAFEIAKRLLGQSNKPVVLLEHADRFNDSTWLLKKAIKAQLTAEIMVPYLWDPESVQKCLASGAGSKVTLKLGGWTSDKAGGPVSVEAEILWVGHKNYIGSGPMRLGRPVDLGDTAVIRIGRITVILTSISTTAIDEDCFVQFGYQLTDFDIVILRSKTHFRAVYEQKTRIIVVDTPDWGTADLSLLPYEHMPEAVRLNCL
ncbi:M81 family metallopeptidase [Sneathiella sp.]|jgi:microcystin degradation protein MlrC|uniref:M81 family metallopeptidase n=1 Tax=Sneathiella sp. TaxID=1964365 RepID=UPI0039E4D0FA